MKLSKRLLLFVCLLFSLLVIAGMGAIWHIPTSLQVIDRQQQVIGEPCLFVLAAPATVSPHLGNRLRLLSWNIYKQKRAGLLTELKTLSQNSDILLLQEVLLTPELSKQLPKPEWHWHQARAFDYRNRAVGVASVSRYPSSLSCGFWQAEPWIQLPKTALLTQYPLQQGDSLWLVNLHAINFSWSLEAYRQQLTQIGTRLQQHTGPLIVAGDFNAWREKRQKLVHNLLEELGMVPIQWKPDHRSLFLGQTMDQIYYRGLNLVQAQSLQSDSSDHSPLWAEFAFIGEKFLAQ